MSEVIINADGQDGVDASGLDHEWRAELTATKQMSETSVLGGLGTIGAITIVPEEINEQFPRLEGDK